MKRIIRLEEKTMETPFRGDFLIYKHGYEHFLLQDCKTEKYTVASLDGKIWSEWLDTVEEIVEKINIVEVIRKHNIEIKEVR